MAEFVGRPFFSCRNCRKPVALADDILSRKFRAKWGPAYMFTNAMNVVVGRTQDRQLMTGVFAVADIYCSNCHEEMGWKYVRAHDPKQKHKEGRFIIDLSKIVKEY
ncbi:protein yippee-like At4g27745 [Eucalyptus grandis]|uniref:protein yippee-like At4g27745 n=1 Tax=Eucalyptus grandis TaxID=71139 RepID=UPI00192E7F02|nr:protein yippee-like At4g27745 [Eucalyptus grandis]